MEAAVGYAEIHIRFHGDAAQGIHDINDRTETDFHIVFGIRAEHGVQRGQAAVRAVIAGVGQFVRIILVSPQVVIIIPGYVHQQDFLRLRVHRYHHVHVGIAHVGH